MAKVYTWDGESMRVLNDIFQELKNQISTLTERIDKLEKEPKVVNNYNTTYTPGVSFPTMPDTNPYKVWCGNKDINVKYE